MAYLETLLLLIGIYRLNLTDSVYIVMGPCCVALPTVLLYHDCSFRPCTGLAYATKFFARRLYEVKLLALPYYLSFSWDQQELALHQIDDVVLT
jgi:hypothetical protein